MTYPGFDRNNDGQINNGSELFGDQTLKYDGTGKCRDGFEALTQEDTNGDGVVDYLDANWGQIKVWRDFNQNGLTDQGELFSLEELGIAGLAVDPTDSGNRPTGDNSISALGQFTWSDGRIGHLGAVDFYNDPAQREFVDELGIPEGLGDLSDVAGSGLVRDLQEAATLSPKLAELIRRFSSAEANQRRVIFDDLLQAWADAGGLAASLKERADSNYIIRYNHFSNTYRTSNIINSRQAAAGGHDAANPGLNQGYRDIIATRQKRIHILEAFNGAYFFVLPEDLTSGQTLPWYVSEAVSHEGNKIIEFT